MAAGHHPDELLMGASPPPPPPPPNAHSQTNHSRKKATAPFGGKRSKQPKNAARTYRRRAIAHRWTALPPAKRDTLATEDDLENLQIPQSEIDEITPLSLLDHFSSDKSDFTLIICPVEPPPNATKRERLDMLENNVHREIQVFKPVIRAWSKYFDTMFDEKKDWVKKQHSFVTLFGDDIDAMVSVLRWMHGGKAAAAHMPALKEGPDAKDKIEVVIAGLVRQEIERKRDTLRDGNIYVSNWVASLPSYLQHLDEYYPYYPYNRKSQTSVPAHTDPSPAGRDSAKAALEAFVSQYAAADKYRVAALVRILDDRFKAAAPHLWGRLHNLGLVDQALDIFRDLPAVCAVRSAANAELSAYDDRMAIFESRIRRGMDIPTAQWNQDYDDVRKLVRQTVGLGEAGDKLLKEYRERHDTNSEGQKMVKGKGKDAVEADQKETAGAQMASAGRALKQALEPIGSCAAKDRLVWVARILMTTAMEHGGSVDYCDLW